VNKMELKKIVVGLIVIALSFILYTTKYFFLVVGVGVLIAIFPFVFTVINNTRMQSEKEEMFLEFARNLVESVKTGTPVSKSIINLKGKPYGVLTSHIDKLANQISLGIPLGISLSIFSRDVDNKTVSRALTLIAQAEKAGGDIGEILEAVAGAVTMSDKLKKERRSAISTLVMQGYLIFFIFAIIILVMQFKILPMIEGIGDIGSMSSFDEKTSITGVSAQELSGAFLLLLLVQGFFSGLTIGELAEGSLKAGLKHSFALMLISFLISTIANVIFS
jgi:flagellar protein FlaJ